MYSTWNTLQLYCSIFKWIISHKIILHGHNLQAWRRCGVKWAISDVSKDLCTFVFRLEQSEKNSFFVYSPSDMTSHSWRCEFYEHRINYKLVFFSSVNMLLNNKYLVESLHSNINMTLRFCDSVSLKNSCFRFQTIRKYDLRFVWSRSLIDGKRNYIYSQ